MNDQVYIEAYRKGDGYLLLTQRDSRGISYVYIDRKEYEAINEIAKLVGWK